MFIDAPGGAAGNASDDDEEKPRTRLDSDGFSKFEEAAANMTIETAETTSGVSRNGTALLKNNNVGGGRDRMHEWESMPMYFSSNLFYSMVKIFIYYAGRCPRH